MPNPRRASICGEMRVIRHFKESAVSFRFFLLSLCLITAAAGAQESVSPETPPVVAPTATSESGTEKAEPALVPLDPASLLSIGVPRSKEERDEMEQRATTLKDESSQRKEEAEKSLTTAKIACWKKFLVSSCLDDARVAYRKDVTISKRQDRESQTLERNVRKYDAFERARQRDEENAKREAENAKKAEKYRAKRAAEVQNP
jgi:colicin import membrane protein